jgi:hypothetical protein
MSLRGRKNLLAGSSISFSAEAAVIRGDAGPKVDALSASFDARTLSCVRAPRRPDPMRAAHLNVVGLNPGIGGCA